MRPFLLCVIGPPGAGKTTLIAQLSALAGGSTFRLREALETYGVHDDPDTVPDELGWVSDAAVARVLRRASGRTGQFVAGPHPVFLDNFPGSSAQFQLLDEQARRSGIGLGVVELIIDDQLLLARIGARRVCPRCQPDLHAPATVVAGGGERCGACGAQVVRRESDSPDRHAGRLTRYRTNGRDLAAATRARGIEHHRLWAGSDVDDVRAAGTRAFMALIGERQQVS